MRLANRRVFLLGVIKRESQRQALFISQFMFENVFKI